MEQEQAFKHEIPVVYSQYFKKNAFVCRTDLSPMATAERIAMSARIVYPPSTYASFPPFKKDFTIKPQKWNDG